MHPVNSVAFLSPQFSVVSESQLMDLHYAALEILRRTGVRFHHRGALDMLKKAGAFISDDNLVRFPARLIKNALASAPSRVIMCDRNGEPAVFLENRTVNFGTGSDCINLLDPVTGEHRKFTQKDIIDAYHLCDALPNIHFVMSVGIPHDLNPQAAYDVQMANMLEHTTKPIVFVTNDKQSCKRAIEMASAIAGDVETLKEHQHILLYSEPSSPLQQSETAIDKLLLMAEYELPVIHSPAPLMGGTGPITMASGIAMSVAEIFSSLVVHQLQQPGAPFIFGAGVHHMDMKAAQICYASPEFQLTKSVIAQLGQMYKLPTWGYAGCTDAKTMDEQAALESLLSVMMAKFSGANLIHDVGYMESGLTCSYEMIVLTDELVELTNHMMKGVEVSPQTLLFDEIDRVGPGGHFLNTDLTHQHFRDYWYPSLLDRGLRRTWLNQGATTLGKRLNARVLEIIANHQPEPLTPSKKEKLDNIMASIPS